MFEAPESSQEALLTSPDMASNPAGVEEDLCWTAPGGSRGRQKPAALAGDRDMDAIAASAGIPPSRDDGSKDPSRDIV